MARPGRISCTAWELRPPGACQRACRNSRASSTCSGRWPGSRPAQGRGPLSWSQPHGFEEKAQPRRVGRGAQCRQQQQAGVVQGSGQAESRPLVRRPQPTRGRGLPSGTDHHAPGADDLPQPPEGGETETPGHSGSGRTSTLSVVSLPTPASSQRPTRQCTELGTHLPVGRGHTSRRASCQALAQR